jgi:hypothetical protein
MIVLRFLLSERASTSLYDLIFIALRAELFYGPEMTEETPNFKAFRSRCGLSFAILLNILVHTEDGTFSLG